MKNNKISVIFFVSILSLAGVGISYAGFTDTISVYGMVNTATVELEIIPWFSGTWVWKIWDLDYIPADPDWPGLDIIWDYAGEILICSGFTQFKPTDIMIEDWLGVENGQYELISFSEAGPGGTHGDIESDIDFEYNNIFPCIDFSADFIIHYIGSIPAKIDPEIIIETMYPEGDHGWLDELYNYDNPEHPDWGINIEAYRAYVWYNVQDDSVANVDITDEVILPGFQLHYCDNIYVQVTIHLPQDDKWQGLYGEFFTKIGVTQWNDQCIDEPPIVVIEYPEDGITVESAYITVTGYATDDFGLFSEGYKHKWEANPTGVAISGTIPMPYPTYLPLSYPFTLELGWNEITFFVTDDAGQYGEDSVEIYFYIPPGPTP